MFKVFNVSISRWKSMTSFCCPHIYIGESFRIGIFYSPISHSINFDFKEMLEKDNLISLQRTIYHISHICLTLLFHTYCSSWTLYQVLTLRLTFFHLLPLSPICVPTWMNPPLLVMIVGILSPIAQQLLFVLVKRRSSAHFPLFRLRPRKEWTYKLKVIL